MCKLGLLLDVRFVVLGIDLAENIRRIGHWQGRVASVIIKDQMVLFRQSIFCLVLLPVSSCAP